MGDFTGFSFGNWHSTDPDTGIVTVHRVSGGDRYTEQLHPEIKDKTAEVPGLNGNYYFGSDFGPTTIDIEIAFDHLTEKQFRDLRKAFGTKEIQPLIFNERPYKKYMAKIESPVELSYICFEERIRQQFSEINNVGELNPETGWPTPGQGTLVPLPDGVRMVDDGQGNRVRQRVNPWVYSDETERIYKGEGKITFVCYFPFAKSNFKVLPEAGQKYYEGSDKWAVSSGILSALQYQNVDKYASNRIIVYNAGDVATGFRLYCPFGSNESTSAMTFTYTHQQDSFQAILEMKSFNAKICGYDDENNPIYDIGFLIDTNTGLITGVKPQTIIAGTIIYDPVTKQLVEASEDNMQVGIIYDENRNASYFTSGNLYNEYVSGGYFFKLEPDDSFNTVTLNTNSKIAITNGVSGIEIFYDYLYF